MKYWFRTLSSVPSEMLLYWRSMRENSRSHHVESRLLDISIFIHALSSCLWIGGVFRTAHAGLLVQIEVWHLLWACYTLVSIIEGCFWGAIFDIWILFYLLVIVIFPLALTHPRVNNIGCGGWIGMVISFRFVIGLSLISLSLVFFSFVPNLRLILSHSLVCNLSGIFFRFVHYLSLIFRQGLILGCLVFCCLVLCSLIPDLGLVLSFCFVSYCFILNLGLVLELC